MSTASAPDRPRESLGVRRRSLKARSFGLARWLHVYTSMISLLIVLFFSITGVLLNHPDWTFGSAEHRQTLTGTLPADWKSGDAVDWLKVTWALEAVGLHGTAGDFRADLSGNTLGFRAPGYSADVTIDPVSGAYRANVIEQGWVAAFGDLHRGRDSGASWSVVLDLAGYFLILISATGLAMLFFLKHIRPSGLLVFLTGAGLAVFLMRIAFK